MKWSFESIFGETRIVKIGRNLHAYFGLEGHKSAANKILSISLDGPESCSKSRKFMSHSCRLEGVFVDK